MTLGSVLVVDDNALYREAVRRNLEFINYKVYEAENADHAMDILHQDRPQVVITDLDMRTRTEGLDLIRDIKTQYPDIPVILISAVGTFDEGAMAKQYGAMYVVSKSRIEQEIENLYQILHQVFQFVEKTTQYRDKLETLLINNDERGISRFREELESHINNPRLDPTLKVPLFELVGKLQSADFARQLAEKVKSDAGTMAEEEPFIRELPSLMPDFNNLDVETQIMMRTASLLQAQEEKSGNVSIARNVGFSYCFAMENEMKIRIGRKVIRFLALPETAQLVKKLYDTTLDNLDLFFTQYLIRSAPQMGADINVDITRQVIERMHKHGDRYKPDGLKALGVIVFCFGRTYDVKLIKGLVEIKNPLSLKGITDEEAIKLSNHLIKLQHLRNPFIHPEFSEREKTTYIRQVAVDGLNLALKLV